MSQNAIAKQQHPTLAYVRQAFKNAEVVRRIQEVMPRGVSAERIMRTTQAALAADAYLLAAEPGSILRAVMRLAQVGLEPNTPLQQAFLVPYKGKCEPILGYRGMVELARRSGQIVSIEARAVFEGDEFTYEFGLEPKLVHRPRRDPDPAKLMHVYAVAQLKGGGQQWDVMTLAEVVRIRDRALAGKRNPGASPWSTDFVEMAKKTVLRRLFKLLPISIHAAEMVEREGAMERGEALSDPEGGDTIDVDAVAPEERAEAEQAVQQQKAAARTEAAGAALADLTGDPPPPSEEEVARAEERIMAEEQGRRGRRG